MADNWVPVYLRVGDGGEVRFAEVEMSASITAVSRGEVENTTTASVELDVDALYRGVARAMRQAADRIEALGGA